MRRIVVSMIALLALVSGCARGGGGPAAPQSAFTSRAQQVAAAWHAIAIATPQWREGFVPLDDLTVPPAGGLPDDATRLAFTSGWYRSTVPLPEQAPPPGRITFADGTTMSAPLVSAHDAYDRLHKSEPSCASPPAPTTGPGGAVGGPAQHTCAYLTVTAVRLGEATIRTSRGAATVPAWLFTVAEAPGTVARVAVADSAVTPVPQPSVPPLDTAGQSALASAQAVTAASGQRLSFTVGVGGCDGDPVAAAYETSDAVVVAARRARTSGGGVCPDFMALRPVTVTLNAPLGARVILDAVTGQPLPGRG